MQSWHPWSKCRRWGYWARGKAGWLIWKKTSKKRWRKVAHTSTRCNAPTHEEIMWLDNFRHLDSCRARSVWRRKKDAHRFFKGAGSARSLAQISKIERNEMGSGAEEEGRGARGPQIGDAVSLLFPSVFIVEISLRTNVHFLMIKFVHIFAYTLLSRVVWKMSSFSHVGFEVEEPNCAAVGAATVEKRLSPKFSSFHLWAQPCWPI